MYFGIDSFYLNERFFKKQNHFEVVNFKSIPESVLSCKKVLSEISNIKYGRWTLNLINQVELLLGSSRECKKNTRQILSLRILARP